MGSRSHGQFVYWNACRVLSAGQFAHRIAVYTDSASRRCDLHLRLDAQRLGAAQPGAVLITPDSVATEIFSYVCGRECLRAAGERRHVGPDENKIDPGCGKAASHGLSERIHSGRFA
jgi:hypothetical protein